MAIRKNIDRAKAAKALSKFREQKPDSKLKLTPGQERTIQTEVREKAAS